MSRFNYPPNDGQDQDGENMDSEFGDEQLDEIPLSGDDLFMAEEDIDESNALRENIEHADISGDIHELLAQKENDLAEMNDRFLRLAAEMENLRRRGEREKQDAGKYAISEFARDLVSVADNFDRALNSIPPETSQISPDTAESLVTGLRMTEKELLAVLQRYGVNRINPTGERFDPNLHQAVAQVPGNGVPAGHVVDVAQTGFTIGDRVLRAAMVTISLGDVPGDTLDNDDPEPTPTDGDPGSTFDTSA